MSAPICPISRNQAVPGMPGIILPYVPKPVDLPSAIAAANQINQILQQLAAPSLGGAFSPSSTSNQDGGKGIPRPVWTEKSRTTKKVKYYNQEDDQIWIEVERITKIVWENKVDRTSLTFKYGG